MPIVVVGVCCAKTVAAGELAGEATGEANGEAIGLATGVEADDIVAGSDRAVAVGVAVIAAAGLEVTVGVLVAVAIGVGVVVATGSGVPAVGEAAAEVAARVGVAENAAVGMRVGTIRPVSGVEAPSRGPLLGGVHCAIGSLDPPASDPTATPIPTEAMIARTTMTKRVFPTVPPHANLITAFSAC